MGLVWDRDKKWVLSKIIDKSSALNWGIITLFSRFQFSIILKWVSGYIVSSILIIETNLLVRGFIRVMVFLY